MESEKLSNAERRKQYRHAYDHLDFYLAQVMSTSGINSMKNILFNLHSELGIRFRQKTIENLLQKRLKEYGRAPLEVIYELDVGYYGEVKPKIPKYPVFQHRKL